MTVAQVVDSVDTPVRYGLDVLSLSVVVATLAGYLPVIASLLSVVWLSLQIYTWIEKRYRAWRENRDAED